MLKQQQLFWVDGQTKLTNQPDLELNLSDGQF